MRYVSREIQRQFAKLLIDAETDQSTLSRVTKALHDNNQAYPAAFVKYLEEHNGRD